MKQFIRNWLGITDLLEESSLWNKELSKSATKIENFRLEFRQLQEANSNAVKEMRNLYQRISQKFDNVTPASPEFFDEMRRQMEARMDQTMNACDRMADEMKRARLTTGV